MFGVLQYTDEQKDHDETCSSMLIFDDDILPTYLRRMYRVMCLPPVVKMNRDYVPPDEELKIIVF